MRKVYCNCIFPLSTIQFTMRSVILNICNDTAFFQANEVLLAGKKLTAVEACNYGLITEVFPQAEFHTDVKKRMIHLVGLPPQVCTLG